MVSPSSSVSDASGFDNYVVGAMIIAFVIFVTARGELATYLQLFFYVPPATSAAAVASAGTGVNSTGTISPSDMSLLQQAASQAAALAKSGVVTP
jgi:hypothetical protein